MKLIKKKVKIPKVQEIYILGGNLQPAWYCASTAEEFAVMAQYWHGASISTTYQRRGSER